MKKTIALIYFATEPADAAEKVIEAVSKKYRHDFSVKKIAVDKSDLTAAQMEKTVKTCLSCDAVIVAESPSSVSDKAVAKYLEKLILGIRNSLKLYTNIVPIKNYAEDNRIDVLCVMDCAGGIYNNESGIRRGKLGREAFDTECYSEIEIERVSRIAFELSENRSHKVLSVDKAELLSSSQLWRTAISDVASDYPDVVLNSVSIEDAIRKINKNIDDLDVVVTTNLFGDILASLLASVSGSEEILPSCYLNDATLGLYLPYRGTENVGLIGYNSPLAAINSVSSALRYSFELYNEAEAIDEAVKKIYLGKFSTPDIAKKDDVVCSAERITEEVLKEI